MRTGLDRLLLEPERLAGRRYGLLGHGAAVSSDLLPVHLALLRAGAEPPRVLFGPEHGFHGVEQDMVPAAGGRDPMTGLPVTSLYGASSDTLRPDPARFTALDLLVVDLQDVGCRYYTYAATAVWAVEAALAAGCEVWVLDRPNPLGGVEIEGNLRRSEYESFVGAFELPVRHGLTLGELVLLEGRRRAWDGELAIWTVEGWERPTRWDPNGRPWTAPSPNMPTPATAYLYPGTCLVEATTLSEGRGTTQPFELVGAPGIEPAALAARLAAADLPGAAFTPVFFRPQYQKHAGELCGGVRIAVVDGSLLRPYRLGVELLRAVAEIAPESFAWRADPYEFVADRAAVDLLTGDSALRRAIDDGEDLTPWIEGWQQDEAAFRRERQQILLYPEDEAAA